MVKAIVPFTILRVKMEGTILRIATISAEVAHVLDIHVLVMDEVHNVPVVCYVTYMQVAYLQT